MNVLKLYLNDISAYPLLSEDEERELFKEYKLGNMEAKDKIINSNLRLVVSIAKGFKNKSVELLDLIGFGNEGLIRAVEGFDVESENRFSSYATSVITSYIRKGLHDYSKPIRIPAYNYTDLNKIKEAEHQLSISLNRKPNVEEIAKESGLDISRINEIYTMFNDVKSLDMNVGDDDSILADFIADDAKSPYEKKMEDDIHNSINKLFDSLSEEEAFIIKAHLGFLDKEYSLSEIGKILNVSRETVRLRQEKALVYLRTLAPKYGLACGITC